MERLEVKSSVFDLLKEVRCSEGYMCLVAGPAHPLSVQHIQGYVIPRFRFVTGAFGSRPIQTRLSQSTRLIGSGVTHGFD